MSLSKYRLSGILDTSSGTNFQGKTGSTTGESARTTQNNLIAMFSCWPQTKFASYSGHEYQCHRNKLEDPSQHPK